MQPSAETDTQERLPHLYTGVGWHAFLGKACLDNLRLGLHPRNLLRNLSIVFCSQFTLQYHSRPPHGYGRHAAQRLQRQSYVWPQSGKGE